MTDSSSRRLRIAVLNRVFAPTGGGAERYSIALVEQLAARHDIHVFAQQIDHAWPGVHYHRVSQPCAKPRWVNQLWYAWATWRATRQGFDVVHSHENTWHGQVQTVHVLPVKYNLFRGRSGAARLARWLKVVLSPRLGSYLWLERLRLAPRPDRCIVAASDTLREVLAESYPASRNATVVISPGVAEVAAAPATLAQQCAAREQLGWPTEGRCVLFVGNDYRKKGLDALLQALAGLPPDVWLAVVGHPGQQGAFQAQAEALGVAGRVHFAGPLQEVTPAYVAADALAHPTLEDTFAMVVLEAMAQGLPVVVSGPAFCGIAGLLSPGRDAWVLPEPRDVAALRQALAEALSGTAATQAVRAAALAFARAHAWPQQARLQEAVYRDVAGRSAPGSD
ncbi:glycosyltransferase family 4 protein [Variovorax terrae]|uniref:Glycosyltransferase family 4 protein n=1 Tax=Variovorax terrae TaxID=2923278 RepID=A0A9X1VT33_9BURK|nr:glycosyltransferase family 4 protein [Variovorax terrae]MCJ0763331.1 glycosyltransferase family 4 protein [Variovorax terrae]